MDSYHKCTLIWNYSAIAGEDLPINTSQRTYQSGVADPFMRLQLFGVDS